jgi:hypothetical protein
MPRPTDPQLRERLLQVCPDEPDVGGLVFGVEAVAQAMGYSTRYLEERYLTDVTTCSPLGPHVLGQHTRFGHFYLVHGQPGTHVSSGAVCGNKLRAHTREQRRAKVPGWHKRPPAGGSITQPAVTISGNLVGARVEWPAFTVYCSEDR